MEAAAGTIISLLYVPVVRLFNRERVTMCGRFSITKKAKDIEERFNAEMDERYFRAAYNAAPSQFLPVITNTDSRRVNFFKWGLVPFWTKDISIGNKIINARAETLTEKPAYRTSLKSKRCLVIADGLYEWLRTGEDKQPYRIVLRDNGLFAFAGLVGRVEKPGRSVAVFIYHYYHGSQQPYADYSYTYAGYCATRSGTNVAQQQQHTGCTGRIKALSG